MLYKLAKEEGIPDYAIERSISYLMGTPIDRNDLVRVIKFKDAAKKLNLSLSGIAYLIKHGKLLAIKGPKSQLLGIRSDSIENYMRRTVIHREKQ